MTTTSYAPPKMFPDVADIVPEGKLGSAEVRHFTINDQAEANWAGLRTRTFDMRPGTYASLFVNGHLVMSDTPYERRTNMRFPIHANGMVLIAGLGLGMVLPPVLAKPDVTLVDVIEISQDVIDLVQPHYRNFPGYEKLTVIPADIFTWRPPTGVKYDTIYFDIWGDISTDVLQEMAKLHMSFGRYLNQKNPRKWMDSWQRDFLKYRKGIQRW